MSMKTTEAMELVVPYVEKPEVSDINLMKLADFMGVPVCGVSVVLEVMRHPRCVAVSARTLRECVGRLSLPSTLQNMGIGPKTDLFVYGFDPCPEDSDLVQTLSGGSFDSVIPLEAGNDQYSVSANSTSFCHEFSGLTFGRTDLSNDVIFQRSKSQGGTVDLIRVGGKPFLAGVQNGARFIVLSGARQILDVDVPVAPGVRPLEWFSRLVPPLMFLRYAFGERCWQPAQKLACFMVDDPLLRSRYGYLRYHSLLEAMERSNFATSIAFVPWNYKRSRRSTADLFLRHPKRFSLSIHGCDHTRGEFGDTDEVLLSKKAAIARKRMQRHRELTGVPFDNVMVFPQGVFSSAAMKALKTAGYLAAVNSTPFPVDASTEPLRVRDLLSPAITRYSGFPLFIRRYPKCIAEFALDLFLGKPALIVEHHDYFRNGYERVQAFAEQINRLSDAITWCGLEDIVRATSLKSRRDDGTFDAQFYDNRLSGVEDGTDGKESLIGANVQVPEVFPAVNGDSDLQLGSPSYRVGVSVRRRLCEFRDNYLSRSRAAMGGLKMLKSKLTN